MSNIKTIEVRQSVFASNEKTADALRRRLKDEGVFLINLMSSPGSGKTTLLKALIPLLSKELKVGVIEADIDSDVDAYAIHDSTGVKTVQVHTGGACHLDAKMVEESLEGLGIEGLDLVILENVGNLVCPAEFDTGAHLSMNILSVPEGDDKPLKYPLMFQVCRIFVVSKLDVAPYFDFSLERAKENVKRVNPNADFYPVSAKERIGVKELAERLIKEVRDLKSL